MEASGRDLPAPAVIERHGHGADEAVHVEGGAPLPPRDILVVKLDPHLEISRNGFALPEDEGSGAQLDLWSLPNIGAVGRAESVGEPALSTRRRSA